MKKKNPINVEERYEKMMEMNSYSYCASIPFQLNLDFFIGSISASTRSGDGP